MTSSLAGRGGRSKTTTNDQAGPRRTKFPGVSARNVVKFDQYTYFYGCMPAPARIESRDETVARPARVATILNRIANQISDYRIRSRGRSTMPPPMPRTPASRAIGSPRVAAPRRPRTPGHALTIRPARGRRAVRPTPTIPALGFITASSGRVRCGAPADHTPSVWSMRPQSDSYPARPTAPRQARPRPGAAIARCPPTRAPAPTLTPTIR